MNGFRDYIPKPIETTLEISKVPGRLEIVERDSISDLVTKHIFEVGRLKDQAVREWLIEQGWTPPIEEVSLE